MTLPDQVDSLTKDRH